LKDYLPDHVTLVEGNLDEFFDLEAGESREFIIKVRIEDADKLPGDYAVYYLVNKVEVEVDNQQDEDTAQVVVEKKRLRVLGQPETGASVLLATIGLMSLAGAGAIISMKPRKK
ncbi:hypothetical protein ACFLZP_05090, partial [Patescibacteria group bacterium]